jgi:LmbE family N-acetylglucosaminyl deacetylase
MPLPASTASVMKTILVLSAHLDDAAFSVGPLLVELQTRYRIIVATVFTKSVLNPRGFALACQLDKGLAADVDYMQLRREEDREWAEQMGVEIKHGPFPEAPHRGYRSAKGLFGKILQTDMIEAEIRVWLQDLSHANQPDVILLPLAIGNHVDHQLLRKTAEATVTDPLTLAYYCDQPYTAKTHAVAPAIRAGHLNPCHSLMVPISRDSIHRAIGSAFAYATQIPFQFGNINEMTLVLDSAWEGGITLAHVAGIPAYLSDLI